MRIQLDPKVSEYFGNTHYIRDRFRDRFGFLPQTPSYNGNECYMDTDAVEESDTEKVKQIQAFLANEENYKELDWPEYVDTVIDRTLIEDHVREKLAVVENPPNILYVAIGWKQRIEFDRKLTQEEEGIVRSALNDFITFEYR